MSDPGTQAPALEMRAVSRRFGNVKALEDAELLVRRGTVHVLLGENGAGKTTLMRIAMGLVSRDAGEIRLFGAPVGPQHSVRDATRAGLGMVHQHPSLAGALTAAENLVLGGRGRHHPDLASEALARVSSASGLRVPADALARDLSVVEQQRLEILKALSRGARLLILDEPTAILAPDEVRDLLAWIRAFVDGGGTAVLITHKLRDALAVGDDVTVLRRGRVVFRAAAGDTNADELRRAIFPDAGTEAGDALSDLDAQDQVARAAPASSPTDAVERVIADAIAVVDQRGITRVRNASFRVRAGEIIGIAAVEGSGHRELLEALAGLRRVSAGRLMAPDEIALIPADRHRHALIPAFTLVENVALRGLGRRRGLMPWASLRERTANLIGAFSIVAPSADAPVRALSGGNQQRLVVARELERDVQLVIADNPTRGLDLVSTGFVHEQLRRAASRGAAVIVHSSDVDEVLALAERVLVVFDGTVQEVAGGRDAVGRAMLGAMGAIA